MPSKYKIIKFSDDCTHCEVCGKTELKGTYIMEDLENGDIFRAGSTCGRKMAGWTTKEFSSKVKEAEKENLRLATLEFRASAEYLAYWDAHNFLDKERDAIHIRMYQCRTEDERNEVRAAERTLESRMEYLMPLSDAHDKKRGDIANKYNVSAWKL